MVDGRISYRGLVQSSGFEDWLSAVLLQFGF